MSKVIKTLQGLNNLALLKVENNPERFSGYEPPLLLRTRPPLTEVSRARRARGTSVRGGLVRNPSMPYEPFLLGVQVVFKFWVNVIAQAFFSRGASEISLKSSVI